MSGINGDKSRFHRKRKRKIARRARNRVQFKNLAKSKRNVSRIESELKEAKLAGEMQ